MPLVTTLANTSARGYGGLKTFGVPSSYYSIQTATVDSGGAANVEFTSIPNTYTHLQIRGIFRGTSAVVNRSLSMQINSDTGSNYADHYLYGNGSSAAADKDTSATYIYIGNGTGNSAPASTFGIFVIDILDYANTNKYKTSRSLVGHDQNGSGQVFLSSGLWQSTNAITSLKFTIIGSENLGQYSQFALYGIKA